MSRKIQRESRSSLVVGGNTSAIDFATSGGDMKYQGRPYSKNSQVDVKIPRPSQPDLNGKIDSSTPEASDSGESGSDDAEIDKEDKDDVDPDVQAPFDTHIAPDKGQAGLHQNSTSMTGKENNLSGEQASDPRSGETLGGLHNDVAPTLVPTEDVPSDDDDYNGVDLISESGDEEPAVEHLEEKAIIESEEDNIGRSLPLSPPNSPSDAFSNFSADLGNTDLNDNPWLTEDPFFAEQINLLDRADFAYDADYFGHTNVLDVPVGVEDAPRRRVRFAEPLMLTSADDTAGPLNSSDLRSSSKHLVINEIQDDKVHLAKDAPSSFEPNSATGGESTHLKSQQHNTSPSATYDLPDNDDAQSSVASSSGYESGFYISKNNTTLMLTFENRSGSGRNH